MRARQMSNDKPFRKIDELVTALSAACGQLGTGALQLDGLETACTDARDLYERLVVLRHKARESAAAPSASTGNRIREQEAPTEEPAPVRLDTRPAAEPASRQTSLIDAIESTEQRKDQVKEDPKAPRTPSLAEKLEKAAVGDLHKAISLSHKFWFVAELFNGDLGAFEKGVEKLNNFKNLTQAMEYLENEVVAKVKGPADPDAITTFTDLVQRRYP